MTFGIKFYNLRDFEAGTPGTHVNSSVNTRASAEQDEGAVTCENRREFLLLKIAAS